jgi:hypothetical protein
VISDGYTPAARTITAGWDRFQPWRTTDDQSLAGTADVQRATELVLEQTEVLCKEWTPSA